MEVGALIPQYAEEVRKTREPGKRVPRRVSWRKRLARWGFVLLVGLALAILGGAYYALSVLAVAAVGGWMEALG